MLVYLLTSIIVFLGLVLYFGLGGPEATAKNGWVEREIVENFKKYGKKPEFLLTCFLMCLIPVFRWIYSISLFLTTLIKRGDLDV